MDSHTTELCFIEVPFRCPLPAFCPICGAPTEKSRRVRAWEGIPLVFTYHLSVGIPYCRSHYQQLAGLALRERLAVWAIFAIPLISVLPAISDWDLRWLFKVGCLFSLICLCLVFYFGRKLSASQGVRIRAQGSIPVYRLCSVSQDWNQMASVLVEKYKKEHPAKT
jgi:hypothetical protein